MPDKYVHMKNKYVFEAIKLANKLLDISTYGIKEAKDDPSMIFFGIIKDYAFKIKKLANKILKDKEQQDADDI